MREPEPATGSDKPGSHIPPPSPAVATARLRDFRSSVSRMSTSDFEAHVTASAAAEDAVNGQAALPNVEINPLICGGRPVIRGTRVPVQVIVDLKDQGAPDEELCEDYGVTTAQIEDALRYANA